MKSIIIFFQNPFIETRDVQKFNEEKSLFKPIHANFPLISHIISKKKGPENKIIIYDEDDIANMTIEINNDNENDDENKDYDIGDDMKNDTLESVKVISLEIINKHSPKFITKKKYFNVEKNKKKKGRKKKSALCKRSIHTKYSRDNILRKIKVKFMNKLVKYINRIILKKYKTKKKLLLPLEAEISQNNTMAFNRMLLNSKLKDIFMNFKISHKFRLQDESHNIKLIQSIYENNIQELVEILECSFLEAFNAFKGINNNEEHKLNDIDKLDTVIEEIRDKEKNEDYLNTFKQVAINFENFYFKKKLKKI